MPIRPTPIRSIFFGCGSAALSLCDFASDPQFSENAARRNRFIIALPTPVSALAQHRFSATAAGRILEAGKKESRAAASAKSPSSLNDRTAAKDSDLRRFPQQRADQRSSESSTRIPRCEQSNRLVRRIVARRLPAPMILLAANSSTTGGNFSERFLCHWGPGTENRDTVHRPADDSRFNSKVVGPPVHNESYPGSELIEHVL